MLVTVEGIETVRIAGKPDVVGKRGVPMGSKDDIRGALRPVAIRRRCDRKHEGAAAVIVLNARFYR